MGTGLAPLLRPGPMFEVSQRECRGGRIPTDPWTDPGATHRALNRQGPNCGWGVCLLSGTTSFRGPLQRPVPPGTRACGKHPSGKVSTHATDAAHSSNAFLTHTPTGGRRRKMAISSEWDSRKKKRGPSVRRIDIFTGGRRQPSPPPRPPDVAPASLSSVIDRCAAPVDVRGARPPFLRAPPFISPGSRSSPPPAGGRAAASPAVSSVALFESAT